MKNTNNNFVRHIRFAIYGFFCLSALSLTSCSEDIVDERTRGFVREAIVSFQVSSVQLQAQASAKGMPVTRAAFAEGLAQQGLTPEDLTSQKLPVTGASGLCLMETTTAGIDGGTQATVNTRASVAKAITTNFPSFGYRGTTADNISGKPWFHNRETDKDGIMSEPELWSSDQPYGKFYGVWPQPDGTEMVISPKEYTGTPYVNFTVNKNVKWQQELMTACSGVVHYETQGVAPTTNLAFRHALTAVRFKVGKNLSYDKTITRVEIVGAKSKGRYTLAADADGNGAQWTDLKEPTTFTLSDIKVKTSEAVNSIIMGKDSDNYTFYMIPQNLDGVSVNIYFDGQGKPLTINLSGSWKAGTTETYALTEENSSWQYVLTVASAAASFKAPKTNNYKIESYRQTSDGQTQQPLAWKVVGYDSNGDGTFTMDDKPAWLTSLSLTSGDGGVGISAETGQATVVPDYANDGERNNNLKNAQAVTGYDLSTKGGTVARTTANCYVISAPGSYRIPLVYGNAITDDATNEHAYKTTQVRDHLLQHFKDHAGVDIDDPWITKTNNGANAPDGAKIVWADESGLVTNYKVNGDYLDFQVTKEGIKSGNAVIAVTRRDTVVWSWHLWFAPQDALNTVTCTDYYNYNYSFTKENLGYKPAANSKSNYDAPRSVRVKVEQLAEGSKETAVFTITQNNGSSYSGGTSTFYQFGRKDPFPGADYVPEGGFNWNGGNNMSIQNGIQNPGTFYPWGSSWSDGYNQSNLWSMDCTYNAYPDYYNDYAVVKTIYDPCPAGYKMPATNAFTGFITIGHFYTNDKGQFNVNGAWNKGWNFNYKRNNSRYTIFFPASNLRDGIGKGSLGPFAGVRGYYWTAGPTGWQEGCCLYLSATRVGPQSKLYRAYGATIRPMAGK